MKLKSKFYLFIIFLLIIPLVFADSGNWPTVTVTGLFIAIIIVALMYMLGHGFHLNEMKAMANEEFYQILVTIVIVGGFIAITALANQLSSGLASSLGLNAKDIQGAGIAMIKSDSDNLATAENDIKTFSLTANEEGSKSAFCSLLGASMNLNGCGGYRTLASPLVVVSSAISIGAAELQSILVLLNFGNSYALSFLLPFGAFLRCFKISRGAGGFLIALSIAFYLILPIAVVFMEQLANTFEKDNNHTQYKFESRPSLPSGYSCNAFDIDGNESDEIKALSDLFNSIDYFVYFVIVKVTLQSIISVLTMIVGLRYLSSMLGVDVDVTALAKIA